MGREKGRKGVSESGKWEKVGGREGEGGGEKGKIERGSIKRITNKQVNKHTNTQKNKHTKEKKRKERKTNNSAQSQSASSPSLERPCSKSVVRTQLCRPWCRFAALLASLERVRECVRE